MANKAERMKGISGNIERILIRSTNWIGDVVMSLPAIENIRLLFPESEITVLAKPWVIPLYEFHPSIDKLMIYRNHKSPVAYPVNIINHAKEIRKRGFHMAILLQNAFEAALLAFLGGVKIRVGYNTDGRGLLLTHPVKRRRHISELHHMDYYLELLRGMGWNTKDIYPRLHTGKDNRKRASEFLRNNHINGFILGIAPGAAYGPTKRWPEEHFALISSMAVESWGAKVLIFGSEADTVIGKRIERMIRGPCINLCGKTSLGDAMALIERCQMMVSNDSGLMHVAYALGVPVVAIFGSTDPDLTGPRTDLSRIVRSGLNCSPCFKPTCNRGYVCLKDITPQEVWAQMEELKARSG